MDRPTAFVDLNLRPDTQVRFVAGAGDPATELYFSANGVTITDELPLLESVASVLNAIAERPWVIPLLLGSLDPGADEPGWWGKVAARLMAERNTAQARVKALEKVTSPGLRATLPLQQFLALQIFVRDLNAKTPGSPHWLVTHTLDFDPSVVPDPRLDLPQYLLWQIDAHANAHAVRKGSYPYLKADIERLLSGETAFDEGVQP